MDEAGCKLSPQFKRGSVALPTGLKCRQSAVTLVAFESDNDEVNKALPQVILGVEHVVQARMILLLMNERTGIFGTASGVSVHPKCGPVFGRVYGRKTEPRQGKGLAPLGCALCWTKKVCFQ